LIYSYIVIVQSTSKVLSQKVHFGSNNIYRYALTWLYWWKLGLKYGPRDWILGHNFWISLYLYYI